MHVNGAVAAKAGARARGRRDRRRVPPPEPLEVVPEPIPLVVLYEDAHLIVIDKPAGLVVHPARRSRERHAGQRAAPPLQGSGGHRRRAAARHRAPARQGHERRDGRDQERPRARRADRRVRREEPRRAGRTRAHVPRDRVAGAAGASRHAAHAVRPPPGAPQEVLVEGADRQARGHALARSSSRFATRRSCGSALETGRTHQIRVHARDHGWPLIGDPVYGHKPRDARSSPRSRRSSAARRCTPRRSRSIIR